MFFFFKQKTAYEMRISDWSSDVCSSDLWRHDSIPGKRLAGKKLSFVPAVIEDAGGTGSAVGGGDEIVIRTAALAIHVPPGASEDHIARVLAAVSRSEGSSRQGRSRCWWRQSRYTSGTVPSVRRRWSSMNSDSTP